MDPQMLRNHLQIFNIDGVRLVFKKNEKQNETALIKCQKAPHFRPPEPPKGGNAYHSWVQALWDSACQTLEGKTSIN